MTHEQQIAAMAERMAKERLGFDDEQLKANPHALESTKRQCITLATIALHFAAEQVRGVIEMQKQHLSVFEEARKFVTKEETLNYIKVSDTMSYLNSSII